MLTRLPRLPLLLLIFASLAACGGSSNSSTPVVDDVPTTPDTGTGDGTSDESTEEPNQAPALSVNDGYTLYQGQQGQLSVTATDSDGEVVSYLWQQTQGLEVDLTGANAAETTIVMPQDFDEAQLLTFSITVTDDDGATASDSVEVQLKRNVAPQVSIDTVGDVYSNDAVVLSADATDTENGTLSYQWQQQSGQAVELNQTDNATLSFTAPTVTDDKPIELVFSVEVTDDFGLTASDSVTVTVQKQPHGLTITRIDAGINQVNPGDEVKWQITGFDDYRAHNITITDHPDSVADISGHPSEISFVAPAVIEASSVYMDVTIKRGSDFVANFTETLEVLPNQQLGFSVTENQAITDGHYVDFNDDGVGDIVSYTANSIVWQQGMGAGVYGDQANLFTLAQGSVEQLQLVDINSDGLLDIAFAHLDGETFRLSYIEQLTAPAQSFSSLNYIGESMSDSMLAGYHFTFGDLTNNNLADVAVTYVMPAQESRSNIQLAWYQQTMAGIFAEQAMIDDDVRTERRTAAYPKVFIEHNSGDAFADIMIWPQFDDYFPIAYRYFSDGANGNIGQFGKSDELVAFSFDTMIGKPLGLASFDFNQDGLKDYAILYQYYSSGTGDVFFVETYTSDAMGGLSLVAEDYQFATSGAMAVGDFNKDGAEELLYGFSDGTRTGMMPTTYNAGFVARLIAAGEGSERQIIYYTDDVEQIKITDFNHDGKDELWLTGGGKTIKLEP